MAGLFKRATLLIVGVVSLPSRSNAADAWHVAPSPTVTIRKIVFQNEAARLSGTLYLPATSGPVPAIVALQDASVGVADAALYRHLREGLPAIGIAVLLFDRRGSGASTGSAATASYETLADDGIAGARAIAKLPQIDPARIGYWGVSQGGWLAMLATTRDPKAAVVVAVSAPLVTPGAQMEFAMANRLRVLGYSEDDVEAMLTARKAWSDYVTGEGTRASAVAALAAIDRKAWFDLMYLPSASQVPQDPSTSSWRKHVNEDPSEVIEKVHVPVLLIFGGADPWIPVSATLDRLRSNDIARTNISYEVIPDASHEMMLLQHDSMSTDQGTLSSVAPQAPAYFMLLASWLTHHLLTK